MSGIFGLLAGGGRVNDPLKPSLAPRVQTSLEGRPKPIGAGQNRLAGNLIWYGDFRQLPDTGTGLLGGKGGIFSGKGASQQYKYSASFMVSLGEQIASVQMIQNGQTYDFFYTPSAEVTALLSAKGITVTSGNTYGMTSLLGTFSQTGWSYLNSAHPTQALNYRGEAVACFPNLGLGLSPSLPNFNFELLWSVNTDIASFGPDANPADWVAQFMSNTDWGAGFPRYLLAGADLYAEPDVYAMADVFWYFGDYRRWARANSLLISPVLTAQTAAQDHLAEVMSATIADFLWDDGYLDIMPYADTNATGNGYSFTANVAPLYALTQDHFLPVDHGPSVGEGDTKVKTITQDPTQTPNVLPLTYLERGNLYNPVTIYRQDDAMIIAGNGRKRYADTAQYDFICNGTTASNSNTLRLHRTKVLQQFFFRLPPQFILVKPMTIVTLTDPQMGLSAQAVRVIEVTRREDLSLEITAEEFLGTVQPPVYDLPQPLGTGYNINQSPGGTAAPVIFEPVAQESESLEVWMAVVGSDLTIWGGAFVWIAATADGTYQQVGQINGSARVGVTTSHLATVTEASVPPTVDGSTLSVDLAQSLGTLSSGTSSDLYNLNTAFWVNGEVMAYQTATLTSGNAYNLTPLVRGAFGTTIADHPAGETFVRLDEQVFRYPFTPDRVGQQIYIKLQSFNVYGGGLQDLSDVAAIAYTIQGTALASDLPDVTNLRATFVDDNAAISWDEVTDFRTPRYEIRRGSSWDAAQSLGTVAHPPYVVPGDGTYLVKARAEPVAGLIVYSQNAASIAQTGTILTDQVVDSYNDATAGWLGVIEGPGSISAGNFVTTVGTINTIAYYYSNHTLDATYDRAVRPDVSWAVQGVAVGSDFLSIADILAEPDLLGFAATALVDGWVEVMVQSDIAGDVYAAFDIYAMPDVYGGTTGTWVKYSPGKFFGRWSRWRIALVSYDATAQAISTTFNFAANVAPRIDHIVNYALNAAGETISFTPDGYSRAVPFVFGPNGATKPSVTVTIQNPQQGDYCYVDPALLSLSSANIRCYDKTGVGVSRTVSIVIEGA